MSVTILEKSVTLYKSPSEGESDLFVTELQEKSLDAFVVPVLSFAFTNINVLSNKLTDSKTDDYGGIIFTSPRSVTGFVIALQLAEKGPKKSSLGDWKNLKCFVVGKSTASAANSAGFKNTSGQDCGNAEKLAEVIISELEASPKLVLFPCSKIRRDHLPDRLKKHDFTVEELVIYETLPNPELQMDIDNIFREKKGQSEYLVFFSPSGVNNALQYLKPPKWDLTKSKVIALGPSTAKELRDKSVEVHAVPKSPTPADLAKLITGNQ